MTQSNKIKSSSRILILDRLRGLLLISMMIYHAMWDCVSIFGVNIPWFRSTAGYIWQQSIGWGFILLSGFCFHLGRKTLKRGLTVFICGAIVSAVTLIFMPEDLIIFGVLTLIGSCMLITAAADKALKKIPSAAGIALFFILFILFKHIQRGYIGIQSVACMNLPAELYSNYFTAFFGMPFKGFKSADYYPLIPWLFLFLTGYYLYSPFEKHGALKKAKNKQGKAGPLSFCGRNSLWIYMIHQPVIYGILYIVFKFCIRN